MTNGEYIEMNCRVSEEVIGQPVVTKYWPCNFDVESCTLYAESCRHAKGDPYPVVAAWARGWPPDDYGMASVVPVPNYSTDLAAAWQIVEHLAGRGWQFLLLRLCDGGTQASFSNQAGVWYESEAETVSLAICRAALDTTTANANGPTAR